MQRQFWGIAAVTAFVLAASGCASPGEDGVPEPTFIAEGQQNVGRGYPDLHQVPRTHQANTDQAHWDAAQADVLAARDALRANPRSEPSPTPEDPNAFLDDARSDLETTRDSH